MRRFGRLAVLTVALLMLVVLVGPASAITDGELAGESHPEVVLILMEVDGEPMYRCSGTMIEPTIVLTAGHCTSNYPDEPFSGMRVFYESDVDNGDNSYPYAGNNSIEAIRWEAHPLYETTAFFYNDVGMIELAEAVPGLIEDNFGTLPEADYLDQFKTKRGHDKTWFTAVGYGLQRVNPVFVESERVRMIAEPRLIQINAPGMTGDFSLLLSNNPKTGGTCFGDSGGPNFYKDTQMVAGVTSFGLNGNCAGTGGVFRMDRQNVLDFVNGF